ncbi:MAG TPA: flagellar hook-associated protein FlgL [Nevskiaceae bacterium]|nr:flagellar hook-associated protein FlgL [Nevskiaceae bacterium]
MRVATSQMNAQGLAALQRQQAQLLRTQTQIGADTRLLRAADDPVAAGTASRLDAHRQRLDDQARAATFARHRLGLEESALAEAGDLLVRARELTVQANSGVQSAESRRAIVVELDGVFEQMLSLANRGDGEGGFLFGGAETRQPPFASAGSGVRYQGGGEAARLQISDTLSVDSGDAGDQIFTQLRSGNGQLSLSAAAGNTGTAAPSVLGPTQQAWANGPYTLSFDATGYTLRDGGGVTVTSGARDGNRVQLGDLALTFNSPPADGDQFTLAPAASQDVFATLRQLRDLAAASPASGAERARQQTALFDGLGALEQAETRLSEVRARVGTRLQAVDRAESEREANRVQIDQTLATTRDLDLAEAATRLNRQLTAVQAAQQSYLRIQGLSLFDRLR